MSIANDITDKAVQTSIVIAWWNTSLSTVGKRRSNEKDKQIDSEVINLLVNYLSVDCLALGEVSFEDLHYLAESCSLKDFGIFDGSLREGRLQFDTGLVYNTRLLEVTNSKSIVTSHGPNSLKVAQRINFSI